MIDHVKAVAEDGLKEIFQAQEGKQRDLLKRLAEVISKVKQLQGGNVSKIFNDFQTNRQ